MTARSDKHADWTADALDRPAVGLEAELTLLLDGRPADPGDVFGDPLGFIRAPTHKIRIWDEVGGGAPPLVPDQP